MRPLVALLLGLATAVAATFLALPRATTVIAPAELPAASGALAPAAASAPAPDLTLAGAPTAAQLNRGARVYRTLCVACHLPDGKGMAAVTPPLAAADFMLADRERAIRTVLKGLAGPITVNGVAYQGSMPALETILTDAQVADVLTFVFNTWGNTGEAFDSAHVARLRADWRDVPRVIAAPTTVQ